MRIRDIIEAGEQQLTFPFVQDSIDYHAEWYDILRFGPDKTAHVSEAEQIRRALEASGAHPIKLSNGLIVYVNETCVIEINGTDTSVEDKSQWLYDADLDTYFPDMEQRFNDEFWSFPSPLYHATTEENVASIQRYGLEARNATRGLGNRGVGNAVFTTMNYEETVQGSYGDYVFEINMPAMAKMRNRPFVAQEPPILESELRNALAYQIGMEDFHSEADSDMSPDTVIVYGNIPARFLRLVEQ